MTKRSTHNEIEIIRQILDSNRPLYNRVLEKIREVRQSLNETTFERGKARYDGNAAIEKSKRQD